jgi:hypothetical protein
MLRVGIGEILMQKVVPNALWLFLNAAQGANCGLDTTTFGPGWSRRCNSLLKIGVE